jgi:Spy/CpxP family protein refolding chaperone
MALCSIAIAAGVIGVVAVVKRLIFHRRFRAFGPYAMAGCGPGFGYGGCGGHFGGYGHWSGRGWGSGPGGSFWLRALFSRLDSTPGQEREIRSAIEELRNTALEAKGGLRSTRDDIARAIRGETFDDAAFGDASARADATTTQLKDALTQALKKIHGVLDANQRERLAELLSKGPGFSRRGWGGPYREAL